MIDCEKVLYNLIAPIVDDSSSISVKQMESLNEGEILFYVYAKAEDIARLIGKQGSMAMAIRTAMSVASLIEDKRISIKFESC